MAAEDRRLPVVYAVDVRARVVEIVVVLPLGGASGAHVAVAGRGQRLAQPLFGRVEALVGERETVHQASRSIRATTAWAGDWRARDRGRTRCGIGHCDLLCVAASSSFQVGWRGSRRRRAKVGIVSTPLIPAEVLASPMTVAHIAVSYTHLT